MNDVWQAVVAVALVAILVLVVVAVFRLASIGRERDAAAREAADLRARLDAFAQAAAEHERDMRGDLAIARREQGDAAAELRNEVGVRLAQFQQGTQQSLADANTAQSAQLQQFGERLGDLTKTVEQKLDGLRSENAKKLDEMRATVDEKLQTTLEARLGESFKQVSERLEQVHRGLGEMQNLAAGVGDLKRVLLNVKTRGGWGEVQLEALLADLLTPAQYAKNVQTRPGSNDRVEFAIRTPGRDDDGTPCWIPIDAKFPLDDWERLQEAQSRADVTAADAARKALTDFIRMQARTIRDKYIEPPYTTEFAIMFLPTEALYAEVLSRPGFSDAVQREFRVVLTGPTILAALLNSLQMGFRTLAIERRSSDVWKVLGQVKSEFAKFSDILARTRKKLEEATHTIDEARGKSTTIVRKLRDVEELPAPPTAPLLGNSVSLTGAEPAEEK
jgi:DNA recombination protein RmuC